MSEQDTTTAGAPGIAAATGYLDNLFGGAPDAPAPAAPDTSQPPPAAATAPAEAPKEAPAPAEAPAPKDPSLSEIIRQQRMDRQARAAKERESQDLRTQLAEARDQLSRLSKADMLGDPVGFAQAHGLSEQEMALIGQAYLYHLVPDKAPPDLRYKMLEAKSARESKARETAREQETRQATEAEQVRKVGEYTTVLNIAVGAWSDAGHYPESRAWFGGNQHEYVDSLVHTARNIAEDARDRGEVADLSPKAVADTLERDIASRAARFRTGGGKPPQQSESAPAKPAAGGKQPAVLSTRGQGGGPEPKALTEEERIRRAVAVLEGSR